MQESSRSFRQLDQSPDKSSLCHVSRDFWGQVWKEFFLFRSISTNITCNAFFNKLNKKQTRRNIMDWLDASPDGRKSLSDFSTHEKATLRRILYWQKDDFFKCSTDRILYWHFQDWLDKATFSERCNITERIFWSCCTYRRAMLLLLAFWLKLLLLIHEQECKLFPIGALMGRLLLICQRICDLFFILRRILEKSIVWRFSFTLPGFPISISLFNIKKMY